MPTNRDAAQAPTCWQDSPSICSALLSISFIFPLYRLTSRETGNLTTGILQVFQVGTGDGSVDDYRPQTLNNHGAGIWGPSSGQVRTPGCFPCGSTHRVRWKGADIATPPRRVVVHGGGVSAGFTTKMLFRNVCKKITFWHFKPSGSWLFVRTALGTTTDNTLLSRKLCPQI